MEVQALLDNIRSFLDPVDGSSDQQRVQQVVQLVVPLLLPNSCDRERLLGALLRVCADKARCVPPASDLTVGLSTLATMLAATDSTPQSPAVNWEFWSEVVHAVCLPVLQTHGVVPEVAPLLALSAQRPECGTLISDWCAGACDAWLTASEAATGGCSIVTVLQALRHFIESPNPQPAITQPALLEAALAAALRVLTTSDEACAAPLDLDAARGFVSAVFLPLLDRALGTRESFAPLLWQTVRAMLKYTTAGVRAQAYAILCAFYERLVTTHTDDNANGPVTASNVSDSTNDPTSTDTNIDANTDTSASTSSIATLGVVDLRCEPDFWQAIQSGLRVDDTFTAKRSLYLMKRIVADSETSARTQFCPKFTGGAELHQQWRAFFLVYESLESGSHHLINAVWELMTRLYPERGAAPPVHESWIWLLYDRGMSHRNDVVQRMVLLSFLDFDFEAHGGWMAHGTVCDVFLHATRPWMYRVRVALDHTAAESTKGKGRSRGCHFGVR